MNDNSYYDLDNTLIFYEQKEVLKRLFEKVDVSKIIFVGGIADYLNLRTNYHLTVNDVDLIYEDEKYIQNFIDTYSYKKYKSKFYNLSSEEVIVVDLPVGKKVVHFDFFQRTINYQFVTTSKLLGVEVLHMNFDEMRMFHNNEISKQTSSKVREKYEWKRLYKHSIKASLYNFMHHNYQKNIQETPIACALTK